MDLGLSQVSIAFLLAALAGLSTAIGALIAFFSKKDNFTFLSVGLGFSAGVMIYISFMEILPSSLSDFSKVYGNMLGSFFAIFCFFLGIIIAALVDKLIPKNLHIKNENGGRASICPLISKEKPINLSLKRTGLLTAVAISVHNLPEGFATFVSSLDNISFGLAIAIAVAIHNIPEGMAVSLPIYHATGERKKAFKYAALSGLTEPIGALIGFFLIFPFINELTLAFSFAIIAGVMVYISFDELLPAARVYGEAHHCLYGLFSGMAIMAISLILLDSV